MIDIAVKKDNQHVAVVRFLGWGIFDRYGKARLMDVMELAKCQGVPVVSERSGFEVLSGSLAPEIVNRIWTEMQDAPVMGRVAGYEWMIQFEAVDRPASRRRTRRKH
jgi:hypothetical protein